MSGRASSASALKDPLWIPVAAAIERAAFDTPLPPSYPIGLAHRKKPLGKVFLIIVNN
jgi:hypothetical protein